MKCIPHILAKGLTFGAVLLSALTLFAQDPNHEIKAVIVDVDTKESLIATALREDIWHADQRAYVVSQDDGASILAVVEYAGEGDIVNGQRMIRFKFETSLGSGFVRKGDLVVVFDLRSYHPFYKGRNELIVGDQGGVSSRYKPLVTQGVAIGDTAQTLNEDDYLIDLYSRSYWGVTDQITLSSLLLGNFFGFPNFSGKARVWNQKYSVVSVGSSAIYDRAKQSGNVVLNFFWDSIDSNSQISHTNFSLGLARWDLKERDSALKLMGSTSIQTGYEIVLTNWDRILWGPSYNFDSKAVGGYVSWVMIWDTYHLQFGLNSTNVSKFRLDAEDGYYPTVEMYWRF